VAGDIAGLLERARRLAGVRSYFAWDGGIRVELAVPDRRDAAWSERYLSTYRSAPPAASDLLVCLCLDPAIVSAMERILSGLKATRSVPFYLNRLADEVRIGSVRLLAPAANTRTEIDNALLPEAELYAVDGRQLFVFVRPSPRMHVVPEVSRVIRDAITKDFMMRGDTLVHAGSIGLDGRGFMFCGDKGAGKSTLVLSAMRQLHANLIANDRVQISRNAADLDAVSWPTAAYFLLSTLEEFGISPDLNFHPDYPQKPFWSEGDEAARASMKVAVLFDETARHLGVTVDSAAALRYVFLIERGGPPGGRLQRCADRREIRAFLARQVFDPDELQYPDPFGFSTLLARPAEPSGADLDALCAHPNVQFFKATGRDTTPAILRFIEQLEVPERGAVRLGG
jgi:hypothetical protein